jgi:hypothetical protein
MGSDVAVRLFAIEWPRRVAATGIQYLVVSHSDPYGPRRCRYTQFAHLGPVRRGKIDANSRAQVGANCSIKKVVQEQLIAVQVALWQRGQVPVQAHGISVVVHAYDQCSSMRIHEARHCLRDDAF